jgi:hypothetical protein
MENENSREKMTDRATALTTEEWADLYTAYGEKVAEYARHEARQISKTWDRTDIESGDIESETWARLAEKGWAVSEFEAQGIDDEAQRLAILKLLVKTVGRTMARRLVGFDYAKDEAQRAEKKEIGEEAYLRQTSMGGPSRGLAQVNPASFSGVPNGDALDDDGSYFASHPSDLVEMEDPNAIDPLDAIIQAEDEEERDGDLTAFRGALNAWSSEALASLTETQRGLFQAYYVEGTIDRLDGAGKRTLARGQTKLDGETINAFRALRASQGLGLGGATAPAGPEDLPEAFVAILGSFRSLI